MDVYSCVLEYSIEFILLPSFTFRLGRVIPAWIFFFFFLNEQLKQIKQICDQFKNMNRNIRFI